jgi:hypothetical protein
MGPQTPYLPATRDTDPQLFPSRAGLAGQTDRDRITRQRLRSSRARLSRQADRRRIATESLCRSKRRSQHHQQKSQHDLRFHAPLQCRSSGLARILSEDQPRNSSKNYVSYMPQSFARPQAAGPRFISVCRVHQAGRAGWDCLTVLSPRTPFPLLQPEFPA